MKQSIQFKLSQNVVLTPQLQQAIRLLQLSTLDLNQEIEQSLQSNPLLELDEPEGNETGVWAREENRPTPDSHNDEPEDRFAASEETAYDTPDSEPAFSADWLAEGGSLSGNGSGKAHDAEEDDHDPVDFQSLQITLREHLGAQLGLMQLGEQERYLVSLLIESLNEDGYLEQSLDDLAELLLNELNASTDAPPSADEDAQALSDREALRDELGIALRWLQNFDPPGIGAQNLQECLVLQLRGQPPSPNRELAIVLAQQHLDLLAARDFARIKRALRCDDDALRAAHALICTLNPRPGAAYSRPDTRYIVPDVVAQKQKGRWIVRLNQEAVPRLRINRLYANLLRSQRASGEGDLAGQLQEAKWLIKSISQRFDTIQRVSQAIVDRQQAFLEHGEVAMRPLTLREIADTLGLHESTISRVTNQKFMATPRGIFELKYFFGSHVATDTGGAASSTAIRALIKKLISEENGHKPLSDAKIAEILGEQGIVVARRTVAKYREGLNISPANLRKSL